MDECLPDAGVLDKSSCQNAFNIIRFQDKPLMFPSVDTYIQEQHQGHTHLERPGLALTHGTERHVLSSILSLVQEKCSEILTSAGPSFLPICCTHTYIRLSHGMRKDDGSIKPSHHLQVSGPNENRRPSITPRWPTVIQP